MLKLNSDVVAVDGLERRTESGADFFVHPGVAEAFGGVGVFWLEDEDAVVGTDEVYGCEGGANLGSGGFADLF